MRLALSNADSSVALAKFVVTELGYQLIFMVTLKKPGGVGKAI